MKTLSSISHAAFMALTDELARADDQEEYLQRLSNSTSKKDQVKWRQFRMLASLENNEEGYMMHLRNTQWSELRVLDEGNGNFRLQVFARVRR